MPEIRYSKRFGYLRVRVILRRVHVRTYEYVRARHEISHGGLALQKIVPRFIVMFVLIIFLNASTTIFRDENN